MSIISTLEIRSESELSSKPSTCILYAPGDGPFEFAAPKMYEKGWSVFPQKSDDKRMPGRLGAATCPKGWGETIKWGQYRDTMPTDAEKQAFYNECGKLNVALALGRASGNIFAIDIDCPTQVVSLRIQEIIFSVLGETPFIRIGSDPKAALLYRTAEDDPIRNRTVSRGQLQYYPGNAVEILGNSGGTPLTLHGIHYKTGRFFFWPKGNPAGRPPTDAPLITSAQLNKALAAVEAEFPFVKAAVPEKGEMTEDDWDKTVNGDYRKPRVFPSADGVVATDGREEILYGIVARAVAGNGFKVLEAKQYGSSALDSVKKDLCVLVLEAFEEVAELSGKWTPAKVGAQISAKVNSECGQLILGNRKPWRNQEILATRVERAEAIKKEEEENLLLATAVPYQALGHDDGVFYVLGRGGQVRDFTAEKLRSLGSLMELADMDFWYDAWPTSKGGVDTQGAQAAIMEACFDKGVYSPNTIRGRGVWLDAGRIVMHLGNNLVVNNENIKPQEFLSKFTYEVSRSFEIVIGEPAMAKEESSGLVKLMRMFSWEKQGMGDLMAGWTFLAPVCGALTWRSHAWLTAEPGTGKSWLLENVIACAIGSIALSVQGSTTEAGIRQALKQDARPVLYDESEGQTEGDRYRIQKVVNLARQSSTGGGAEILLGTSDQKGASYSTKASFLFSSANVNINQSADQRRWIIATLKNNTNAAAKAETFAAIRKARGALFSSEDFSARLLSRALKFLPDILKTVNVLVDALVLAGGEQATAWTVAVPLAGCWHLQHDDVPNSVEASEFVHPFSVQGSSVAVEREPEWSQCLSYLLQQEVECQEDTHRVRRSIGKLISRMKWAPYDAVEILKEYGIKEHEGMILFAGNSAAVAKFMKGSTWGLSWSETLARAPGATRRKATRFTPTMMCSSAIAVPKELIIHDSSDNEVSIPVGATFPKGKIPLTD